jgi:subtilisin family serine protease
MAVPESYNGHPVASRQVLMKVQGASSAILEQLRQFADADDLRPLNGALGLYVIHSRSAAVPALLAAVRALPFVVYAEPDYIVKTLATPNDPNFAQQWSFLNTSAPGADIGATSAWDVSTGSTANVVGVIDTGVDYTHPDLAANIWSAPSAFTVTLSWGQLTCPAGSHGYNAITRSCDPRDDHGHGTHVSGTIGAIGNNGAGVAGVNWSTRIMAMKFLDSAGNGSTSDAIDSIEFAIQVKAQFAASNLANVRVLSNSWGGPESSQSLLQEITKANTNEMLFVAAAGNSSQNNDATPTYPAAFNIPNLVAVAATTSTDTLASFSNWGKSTVLLGAPGVNVISTVPGGGYAYMSGTSMATPHVSGAAMLVLSKCSVNTSSLRSLLAANVDPLASLATLVASGGRLNVNKAIRSCASTAPAGGTAAFVKTDTTTQGGWKSAYGADGYNVINDTANYPGYVTVTPAGFNSYIWASSTGDVRGLQKATQSDRLAACWYTFGASTIDVNFKDQSAHQVALYLLDWDVAQRVEKVDILDASNNLLDTRTVTSFSGGQYLVWNLSGHVIIRITNASVNAVVSGIFFGGGTATQPSGGTAAFVKTDTTTQGGWKGAYGGDGYNVINDSASYPAYATVTPSGFNSYVWASSTGDVRALQKVTQSDRLAACWYTLGASTIDLAFKDSNTHQVALYLLDWDPAQRVEKIDILDASNNVLDTRTVSGFSGGQYLVWNLSGHVIIRITNASVNAVVSGIFFGAAGSTQPPGSGTAAFLKTDVTTQGSWKGVYGADGYNVINDASSYPAYATVTPTGFYSYVWASTTDVRALQRVSLPNRLAACWYTLDASTIDVNFSDQNTHQVALYLLDWDPAQRVEKIDILDASNNVLDTRTVSGFSGGQYLVWNLSGHVIIRVTNASVNAVVSGIFFR